MNKCNLCHSKQFVRENTNDHYTVLQQINKSGSVSMFVVERDIANDWDTRCKFLNEAECDIWYNQMPPFCKCDTLPPTMGESR